MKWYCRSTFVALVVTCVSPDFMVPHSVLPGVDATPDKQVLTGRAKLNLISPRQGMHRSLLFLSRSKTDR